MFRRLALFIVFILLVAAASSVVYLNAQPTAFHPLPGTEWNLPLGILILAAGLIGASLSFVFALLREGRHALREWRVQRELSHAERTAEYKTTARALLLAGDYERARSALTKATQTKPPDVSDVVDYAETFLQAGDTAGARRALEEGQKEFGNNPLLLHGLARVLLADGDEDGAVAALERAVSVYPSSTVLLEMLRDLLFARGKWERATEIQQRLVELRPDDPRERNRLLGARFEAALRLNGNGRGAALQRLNREDPDFVPAICARAEALAEGGETRKALRLLERAARRRPRTGILETLERLATTDFRPRLIKFYPKLVARHPDNVALKLRAARVLLEAGKLADADKILSSIDASVDRATIAALRALLEERREHAELAHREARRAIEEAHLDVPRPQCASCGAPSNAWKPRCPACGTWGSLETA